VSDTKHEGKRRKGVTQMTPRRPKEKLAWGDWTGLKKVRFPNKIHENGVVLGKKSRLKE